MKVVEEVPSLSCFDLSLGTVNKDRKDPHVSADANRREEVNFVSYCSQFQVVDYKFLQGTS